MLVTKQGIKLYFIPISRKLLVNLEQIIQMNDAAHSFRSRISLTNRLDHKPHWHSHHTRSPARRWGAMGSAAGGGVKRPERVAAVGEGCRRTVAKDFRRAPQQENIFAPTPRMKPSACVKLGPIHSCSNRTKFYKFSVDF